MVSLKVKSKNIKTKFLKLGNICSCSYFINYDNFKKLYLRLSYSTEIKTEINLINRDRRVLLQLPQEERQILEELLNPETI